MIKLANHFGKLFGGLLKATKAKTMHKLGARNTTPRYTYNRNVYMCFLKCTEGVHSSTTDKNPKEEESNVHHQWNEYVNCGIAIQWGKENEQTIVICKNVDEFHKHNSEKSQIFFRVQLYDFNYV